MEVFPKDILEIISQLADALPDTKSLPITVEGWSGSMRRELDYAAESLISQLREFQCALDPIALPGKILDPSNPATFAELIASNLMFRRRRSLSDVVSSKFYGSGVYAIFYDGDFEAYQPIVGTETPIYTGKSQPESASTTPKEQGVKLHQRLKEHAKSIDKADNLKLADFTCRYLVVATGWEKAAEHYLISHYHPIWNKESKVCQGFGKHGDAAATRRNSRSAWDTLHMGRNWAKTDDNKPNDKSVEDILRAIADHYTKYPPNQESEL